MVEAERRVSAIHQSLTQPILLAGAERPLAIANWITAAALVFGGGLHWYTIAMGTLLLTVGHWALVQAAKFDPQLSRVYVRHVHHQDYYPARASVTAPPPRIRPSVPTPKEIRA
jgi:type IV secretory pathway TrbD component